MFGIINNEQNIINTDKFGKLTNNPKFIAVQCKISEENLYNLIQKYYNNKDKDNLLKSCNVYHNYDYKKYLDIINEYINEYK